MSSVYDDFLCAFYHMEVLHEVYSQLLIVKQSYTVEEHSQTNIVFIIDFYGLRPSSVEAERALALDI